MVFSDERPTVSVHLRLPPGHVESRLDRENHTYSCFRVVVILFLNDEIVETQNKERILMENGFVQVGTIVTGLLSFMNDTAPTLGERSLLNLLSLEKFMAFSVLGTIQEH